MKKVKFKKPFWEQENPKKRSKKLTSKEKSAAKARAKAAGRPYPNLIDNAAVARGAENE
jgi:hypothetical protein